MLNLLLSFFTDLEMWISFVLILPASIGTRKEKATHDAYEGHGSTEKSRSEYQARQVWGCEGFVVQWPGREQRRSWARLCGAAGAASLKHGQSSLPPRRGFPARGSGGPRAQHRCETQRHRRRSESLLFSVFLCVRWLTSSSDKPAFSLILLLLLAYLNNPFCCPPQYNPAWTLSELWPH